MEKACRNSTLVVRIRPERLPPRLVQEKGIGNSPVAELSGRGCSISHTILDGIVVCRRRLKKRQKRCFLPDQHLLSISHAAQSIQTRTTYVLYLFPRMALIAAVQLSLLNKQFSLRFSATICYCRTGPVSHYPSVLQCGQVLAHYLLSASVRGDQHCSHAHCAYLCPCVAAKSCHLSRPCTIVQWFVFSRSAFNGYAARVPHF